MPRYRKKPYTFYTRETKDGAEVYYYRAALPGGGRSPGRSTGTDDIREAVLYCEDLYLKGELVPSREIKPPKPPEEVRRSRRPPTLLEWVGERKWFIWTDRGPQCLYCIGELARSSPEAPAIQRLHADDCRRMLLDFILPTLGPYRMDAITPAQCEDLLSSWRTAGVSPKTINNRASVARVIFGEAVRLGVIASSPWTAVKNYRAAKGGKGILSLDEYRRLMAPDSLGDRWKRAIYYDINLLSSVTGLRQGECLDLRREAIHRDHITVAGSWDLKYGEGPQKTKRGTDQIPVPRFVGDRLLALAEITKPGGFIFSLGDGSRPCTGNRVNDALIAALEIIGISDESRRARKLTFHSWRAFANTYFRSAGVPDAKVRQITRHETEAMTEHYSAFRLEDFREVAEAQSALVKLLAVE